MSRYLPRDRCLCLGDLISSLQLFHVREIVIPILLRLQSYKTHREATCYQLAEGAFEFRCVCPGSSNCWTSPSLGLSIPYSHLYLDPRAWHADLRACGPLRLDVIHLVCAVCLHAHIHTHTHLYIHTYLYNIHMYTCV